jgi:hypothetical protein
MIYLEKRTKVFSRPVVIRQRAIKKRPLEITSGVSFVGLHFAYWSLLVGKKKTATRKCKSVGKSKSWYF